MHPVNKLFRVLYLILHLMLTGSFFADGQETVFKNFKIEHGLISNETQDILCDKKGYIWFSSDAGICQYDGYRFKTFTEDDGLIESSVLNLYEDPSGRIWFTTISSYIGYIEHEVVHMLPYQFTDDVTKKKVSFAYWLHVDEEQNLWVGCLFSGSLYRMAFPWNKKPKIFSQDAHYVCHFEHSKRLIFGIKHGANAFNHLTIKHGEISRKQLVTLDHTPLIRSISKGDKDVLFFYYDKTIFRIEHGIITELAQFDQPISSISYDNKSKHLYIGLLGQGLMEFDPIRKKVIKQFLTGFTINRIIRDKNDCFWGTTFQHGILFIPDIGSERLFEKETANTDILDLIELDESKLAFLDSKGMIRSFKGNRLIAQQDAHAFNIFFNGKKRIYPNSSYCKNSFLTDDLKSSNLTISNPFTYELFIKSGWLSDQGEFYTASNQVLFKETSPGKLSALTHLETRIHHFTGDGKGNFWFATIDGLYHWNQKMKKAQLVHSNDSIIRQRCDHLFREKNGNLWFSIRNRGLVCLKTDGTIVRINKRDGLADNFIRALFWDGAETLWAVTNKGMCSIHLKKQKITDYAQLNGLGIGTINKVIITNKLIYLACSNGLYRLNKAALNNISFNSSQPIYVSASLLNNRKTIRHNNELNYKNNDIRFEYICLHFLKPPNFTYRYRLCGQKDVWHYTTNLAVNYTNLSPGKYCFIVQSSNGNKHFSKSAIFKFTITPPFWTRWWFILIISTLLLTACYLYFQFLLKKAAQKRTHKLTAELSKASMESRYLRAQMNPHFIFNAMNTIQAFILKNENSKAYYYLGKFSKLLRNILETSKLDHIELGKELEMIDQYVKLESIRMAHEPKFEIELDENVKNLHRLIPAMLIQPFIENAILHGLMPLTDRLPELIISFQSADNMLICRIKDNGIGRLKAEEIKLKKRDYHQSLSLSISRERLHLYETLYLSQSKMEIIDLFSDDGSSAGTEVILTIPWKDKV